MSYMAWDQGTRRDLKDKKHKETLNTQLKYLNFHLSENDVILMQIMLCDAERIEKEHSEEYNERNKELRTDEGETERASYSGNEKGETERVTCRMWNSSLRYACLLISLQFHDW